MLTLKLAFKNITHAGLRTWLNVFVLSFAFVLIVGLEGFYDGMSRQIRDAMIHSEIGGGQYWQKNYDPYDVFTIDEAHGPIPDAFKKEIAAGKTTPVLLIQSAIFPAGHMQTVFLKGIEPFQNIVDLPTGELSSKDTMSIPGIIGSRMAESAGLHEGDYVTARWRTVKGTFDAGDIRIIKIFNTTVQTVDRGQIWVPLDKLQKMADAAGQATLFIISTNNSSGDRLSSQDWQFKSQNMLLSDIDTYIRQKRLSAIFFYVILLGMALIAIFDTQVLAIFRRRKEMGTLMALGMTRWELICLFTFEGSLLGFLSLLTGAIYGIPLLTILMNSGITLPTSTQQVGFAIGARLYPHYAFSLYAMTAALLFVSVVVVSFLPTRKISHLRPTEALKGKL